MNADTNILGPKKSKINLNWKSGQDLFKGETDHKQAINVIIRSQDKSRNGC